MGIPDVPRAPIAIAGLAVVLGGVAFLLRARIAVLSSRWRRAALIKRLAATFGGTREGKRLAFTRGDTSYRCDTFAGTRRTAAYAEIQCWSAPVARFVITKPGWMSRLPSLSSVASTGDPELDASLVVSTTDPIAAGAFLHDPARRAALRAIFALDPTQLEQDDARLRVRWPLLIPAAALAERIAAVLEPMKALVAAAPSTEATARALRHDRADRRRGWLVSAAAVAIFTIYFHADSHYVPLDVSEMMHDGTAYVLPLALGVALWAMKRGRSSSGPIRSPIAMFGLVLIGALGIAMLVNGAWDPGPATPHDARLIPPDPASDESRYVQVESWRGRRPEKIHVSRSFYESAIKSADRVRVVTRPGWLGYEWIVSYGPADGST